MSFRLKPVRLVVPLALVLAGVAAAIVLFALPHGSAARARRLVRACPNGYVRELDAGEQGDRARGTGDREERDREKHSAAPRRCEARFHPESFGDLSRANSAKVSQTTD